MKFRWSKRKNALQSAEAAGANLGIARAQFEHAIALLIGNTGVQFFASG